MKRLITGFVILALVLAGASVHAATVGKVTGVVADAATGETLPGVNVLVEGTQRGATTDVDGRYVILAVDAGTYTVTATMVGFATSKREQVLVQADYTTTVDFMLRESTLEMSEMVVTADRPPVEPDKTTSKYVVSAADIEAVPQVRATSQLIALQPGMALDGSNRIRGSVTQAQAGTQVGYYVDGIEVDRSMLTNVNTTAIQEISVLTGGMNAEYGNASAGVVNLVTREGGSKLQTRLEYKFTPSGKKHWGNEVYESPIYEDNVKWGDPAWVNETYQDPGPDRILGNGDDITRPAHERVDYTDQRGHRVEATLSGPITPELTFFASGTYAQSPTRFPSADLVVADPPRVQATLSYRPSSSVKVKWTTMYQTSDEFEGGERTFAANNTQNIFFPEDFSQSGTYSLSRQLQVLTLTHALSPNTFYDLRIYYNAFDRDTSNVPVRTEATRRDADGFFYLPTLTRYYIEEEDTRLGLKLDFTSQVNASHLVQAGAKLESQAYHRTHENFSNTSNRYMDFIANDFNIGEDVKPWRANLYLQDKVEFGGLVANLGLRYDFYNFGRKGHLAQALGRSPMYQLFNRAQYELEHMDSNTPTMSALSPRVGISHPITEKLSAHYFIGRSHTFPELLYTHRRSFQSDAPDRDVNGNGSIDETEKFNSMEVQSVSWQPSDGQKPQRSTSMEMGVDWNFVNDYTASITAHYRRDEGLYASNNISYWIDPVSGQSIQINALRNTYWQTARGVELSLKKSFSSNFQFNLSYNAEWVRDPGGIHYGKHSANWYVIPDSDFIASGHYWRDWTANPDGSESPVPLTAQEIADIGAAADATLQSWFDRAGTPGPGAGPWQEPIKTNEAGIWTAAAGQVFTSEPTSDQRRNQLSLQFNYITQPGHGPMLGRIHPFGGLRISAIYRLISGAPFEYIPPEGPREFRTASPIMKTDLHAAKDFKPMGGVRPSIFVEVSNLFNEKSSDSRNSDFTFIQYGLKLPPPDDADYLLYGDPLEATRYDYPPREVELGIELRF